MIWAYKEITFGHLGKLSFRLKKIIPLLLEIGIAECALRLGCNAARAGGQHVNGCPSPLKHNS
eukprot:6188126-Pleurochrysis_carterae.AAC.2